MAASSIARIQVSGSARRGEIVTVRVSIQHPMETGFRQDNSGRAIAKNVIHTLTASFNGTEVFRADMGSGISANPYLQFHFRVETSGELVLSWVDDEDVRGSERAKIAVAT